MTNKTKIADYLRQTKEFANAEESSVEQLAKASEEVVISQGQTLLRNSTIETHAFLILEGTIRLLAVDPISKDLFTVGLRKPGDVVGVIDLLRQSSCEGAIARQPCRLLSIPLKLIFELSKIDKGLWTSLNQAESPCEGVKVLSRVLEKLNPPPKDSQKWLKDQSNTNAAQDQEKYLLLSTELPGHEGLVGEHVNQETINKLQKTSNLPIRLWQWNKYELDKKEKEISENHIDKNAQINEQNEQSTDEDLPHWIASEGINMAAVGIRESKKDIDLQGFRLIRGKGVVGSNLATLRMIAHAYETPCPLDVLERTLEGAAARAGSIPIHGMGQLIESMGLQTQVGQIKFNQLHRLELPVVISNKGHYALATQIENEEILLADPEYGWTKIPFEKARSEWGDEIQVILLKRLDTTAQKTFGWNWFTPVIKRFQWPLVQVLLASLFIQLFQLANPLLLQQIIDKVINQSNLSALQVLGAALVLAALFQGILTAVRTWLLIDTTDRMDLLLGSQVIDKLLRLPLRFFEKRPVGELSQRLSELGNLRSFLTGTAITSALDLLFATIYILIMIVYSPILTAVALGTVPLYVLIILFIAPLYRRLIRKQAQYSARTQSHLIETLGGIQTVKAQHFELNSRWRWQERYSGQISEGFKSVVLGSSTSEVGNFLNQLSSLLIIWVGVYQVVDGKLSLGQLIAFRIIAGYVTGPVLRLSGLWQGFQQVGISMERLADIVDQIPEAGEQDSEKISLPSISGKIKFENVSFRFNDKGAFQIDCVNLDVKEGSFIGVVGQSGSGKSTLMKLLPRLYEPNEGRILIDDYDISKVNLSSVRQQIGIVPQDCLLFEGTIRENIAMNNPEADTESVIRVAKAAEAHEFIMELPDGYGTRLGERGAGLSGGQRQRIAIARTLLQNPNLLILDEATSALDYDTESSVCRNLQTCLKGKTVLFITHRLSTVRNADQIVLMHQGQVTEKGTHEELINANGRYSSLYAHQGDN